MIRKSFFLILLLTVFLAGCAPSSSAGGSSLTLSEPASGAVYQLGNLVQARSQIISSDGAKQVDLLVNGVTVRTDTPSPVVRQGNLLQPWMPPQAGTYTIQTHMTTTSGAQIQSEIVTIQVGGVSEPLTQPTAVTVPPIATTPPTFTMIPTLTITLTPTFTSMPSPPMVTAFQDANCRFGPGNVYDVVGALLNGNSAPIVGRNVETTWWMVTTNQGATCWVWDGTVSISGDTSQVPVIAPPPTPTFTPIITPISQPAPLSPSGELTCRSSVFLEWIPVSHPNGINHYEWQVTGPGGNQNGNTSSVKVEFFVHCASSYSWQVRAVDGKGNTGPYSNAVSFQIK